MTRPLPWLLSLPLMAAGCLGAHSLAYRLVGSDEPEVSHSYLTLAPLVLAIGVALGAVGAARSALERRTQGGAPAYLFALLPPLGFTLQEFLEHAFIAGALPLEPAFGVGLLLQLPFALCALLVARSLLRVAETAGELLRRVISTRRRPPVLLRPPLIDVRPRIGALASAQAGRAPPPSS